MSFKLKHELNGIMIETFENLSASLEIKQRNMLSHPAENIES